MGIFFQCYIKLPKKQKCEIICEHERGNIMRKLTAVEEQELIHRNKNYRRFISLERKSKRRK